jgi:hypothetical protein
VDSESVALEYCTILTFIDWINDLYGLSVLSIGFGGYNELSPFALIFKVCMGIHAGPRIGDYGISDLPQFFSRAKPKHLRDFADTKFCKINNLLVLSLKK